MNVIFLLNMYLLVMNQPLFSLYDGMGENSFYQVLNRALRAEDRSSLKPWFANLKLFDTAAHKLPTVRKNLWRGVARDIAKNFKKGDEFTWWSISSC
jgi:hypothetical protein